MITQYFRLKEIFFWFWIIFEAESTHKYVLSLDVFVAKNATDTDDFAMKKKYQKVSVIGYTVMWYFLW